MRRVLSFIATMALAAACSTSTASSVASPMAAAAPSTAASGILPAIGALDSPVLVASSGAEPIESQRVAYVRGTDSCKVTSRSDDTRGTTWIVREHFRCTNDTNDPRVNGQVDFDVVTTFEPAESRAGRWVADFTIVNDGGSWRGKGTGAVVDWPGADFGYPRMLNYGVDIYEGAGGYAGLTYHEFIGGPANELADLSGWIALR